MFTAQVYWTLRWINTVLMKQKHVRITQHALYCFNTCGFLCYLHLYVSLRCVSHNEGRPEELSYQNICVKYYIWFLMAAKSRMRTTKGSERWLVWKTKHIVSEKVSANDLCVVQNFSCFINCGVVYVFHTERCRGEQCEVLQKEREREEPGSYLTQWRLMKHTEIGFFAFTVF